MLQVLQVVIELAHHVAFVLQQALYQLVLLTVSRLAYSLKELTQLGFVHLVKVSFIFAANQAQTAVNCNQFLSNIELVFNVNIKQTAKEAHIFLAVLGN